MNYCAEPKPNARVLVPIVGPNNGLLNRAYVNSEPVPNQMYPP